MKNNKVFVFILLFVSNLFFAQNDSGYYDMKAMKGFPSLVKQLGKYTVVNDDLRFISLSEAQFNGLFYKNYITDSNPEKTAFYHRMNLIFTRPYELNFTRFEGFSFIINPLIKEQQYSQHLFTVTKALDSYKATLATSEVLIKFPDGLLSPVKEKDSTRVLVHAKGGLVMNIANGSTEIKDIDGFEMTPFIFNAFPLSIKSTEESKLVFSSKEDNSLIFENNEITRLVDFYGKNNDKRANYYLSALQFTDLQGTIEINKNNYKVKINELDFTENLTVGVLKIITSEKAQLANDIAYFVNGKPNLNIKSDFKVVKGGKTNFYYSFKQDYKSVYMYFILYR